MKVSKVSYQDVLNAHPRQVNIIVLAAPLDRIRLEVGAELGEDRAQRIDGIVLEHSAMI